MFYERKKYFEKIQSALQKIPIVVLIGARQVGKTSLMNNIQLKGKKHYLNGQDITVQEIFSSYDSVKQYIKININSKLNGYLLIDEFQFIDKISTTLKLLVDEFKQLKIICSGSSSLGIIQKVEESLAGRVRIINIHSLSFEEYLLFQDKNLYNLYTKYTINTLDSVVKVEIKNHLSTYLIYGGMPRTALTIKEEEKIELLDDIYKTYLLRDVKNFIRNEDTVGFNKLLRLLSAQIGNLISINELSGKSGLSYKYCEEYLSLLEQMYIIKLIEPYSVNKRNIITKMKKVYFTDLGLRNIIYGSFLPIESRIDNGAIFENFVFLELIKHYPSYSKIYYYRTKDGSEIDFIVDDLKGIIIFEVKYKQFEKPRMFKNISTFTEIVNPKKIYLINLNLNEIFNDIHFLPAYLVSKV